MTARDLDGRLPEGLSAWARSGLVVGLLAAALGIPAALVLAVAGFLGGGWNGLPGPGVPTLIVVLHERLPALYANPDGSFLNAAYGRLLLFVFLGLLAGTLTLRAAPSRFGRVLTAVCAGLVLNTLGNVTDYWLGQEFHEGLWRWGFVLGTLLGMLVTLVSTSVLGVLWWRSGAPRPVALGLVLALPLAVVVTVFGVRYMPSGMVVPLCAVWGLAFAWSLRTGRRN